MVFYFASTGVAGELIPHTGGTPFAPILPANFNTLINNMKRILGIVLLVVGILMLIYTGFSYTRREKVVDAGPVHISADKEKTVNWPPYAGGILVLGGIVLLATGSRRNG